VAKRNAVRSATERTQAKMHEFFSKTTSEIDTLIAQVALKFVLADWYAKSGQMDDKVRNMDLLKQQNELQKVHKFKG
jgi:hypothetical protein